MAASRLISSGLTEPRVWRIEARWLTKLFVGADVVCFLIQSAASGLLYTTDGDMKDRADTQRLGQVIYLVGCGIQLAFIITFSFFLGSYLQKVRQTMTTGLQVRRAKLLLYALFAIMFLIVVSTARDSHYMYTDVSDKIPSQVRLAFRLAEYGPETTHDNPLVNIELYTLLLDAAPMIIAMALLNIFHPGYFTCSGARKDFEFDCLLRPT